MTSFMCLLLLLVCIVNVSARSSKINFRTVATSQGWRRQESPPPQQLSTNQQEHQDCSQCLELRGGAKSSERKPAEQDDGANAINAKNNNTSKDRYNMDFIYYATKQALSSILKDPDALRIVSRIISTIAWAYIILSAVGTLGFDTKPLLSLLGIGGLTLGFSVKDMLADSFAGLFVLFTRPFQRGDMVTINSHRGKVVSMDMRYVKMYNAAEGCEILIPVSSVYKSEIKIERSVVS